MQVAVSTTHQRITFDKLRLKHIDKDQCVILVALAWPHGEIFFGTCKGEDSPTGQLACTAKATICALERAADHRVGFELERIREIGEDDTVLAHLSISQPAGDHVQELCGACLVNGEPLDAAAKAVLKATNRLFEAEFIFLR